MGLNELAKPGLGIELEEGLPACVVGFGEATHSESIVKGLGDIVENLDESGVVLNFSYQRLVETLDHLEHQVPLSFREGDIEARTLPELTRMVFFLD